MTKPEARQEAVQEQNEGSVGSSSRFSFRITGKVAYSRIQPLLLADSDCCFDDAADDIPPDFLWENAPRHDTAQIRDFVRCYSHLPNGTAILDSKWVLGRLLGGRGSDATNAPLAVLETHCFRGITGFCKFAESENLLSSSNSDHEQPETKDPNFYFRDLMDNDDGEQTHCRERKDVPPPPNMWVIKDSYSNGAGGIWVVGRSNAADFTDWQQSVLTEEHYYVAQRYAWPPVTFRQRKLHVRVYAALTADQRAFCHRRCFLHVANDKFNIHHDGGRYQDSVHITNCCANSHDNNKFAGEICADLEAFQHSSSGPADHDLCIGLGHFSPSIKASVAALAEKTFPFLNGGKANNGFEYLGLDFILSYRGDQPIAYLLEVNAPPSQDTATGLKHAEDLHDTVIRDLLTMWVFPKVTGSAPVCGGWRCVYEKVEEDVVQEKEGDAILPSKAAILNKIRWTLYERKQLAEHKKTCGPATILNENDNTATSISNYARTFFPYYNEGIDDAATSQASSPPKIFFENAGGTQVPLQVIDAVSASLKSRHRAAVGAKSAAAAKDTLLTILGASSDKYSIFLGSNASTALFILAQRYVQSGLLKKGDEVIIRSDNHLANVQPWLDAAETVAAVVKWWDPSMNLPDLITAKSRIIAVPHASNVIGTLVDIQSVRSTVHRLTNGYGHIVVDGVAAAPHRFAAVDEVQVDWYVISCHKFFGPHLSALCGRTSIVKQLGDRVVGLQIGTVNYEACEGVRGLGRYLADLSTHSLSSRDKSNRDDVTSNNQAVLSASSVREAYRLIETAESPLVKSLLNGLQSFPKVRVIENKEEDAAQRLPVVCFVHDDIPSSDIVAQCTRGCVICRNGTFLSTKHLQKEYGINCAEGIVRFSLAHYNTVSEVNLALRLLQSIPGWF